MRRYAWSERQQLADLLADVGPEAPTIDDGWRTRDLAAHLVLRERRPAAALGIALPPLRSYAERVRGALAAQPYGRLVELIRRPPFWSPVSNPVADDLANTLEFYIHHEDVRRAQPEWRPRELSRGHHAALWRRGAPIARLRLRRFPATLLVQASGYGETSTGVGGERLRLVGTPGELVLFLSGRQHVARVQVDGARSLVDRLRRSRLGF